MEVRTPRQHWWKVDGKVYRSTQAMLEGTEVPPEGRVVTYGFKNYDETSELKGILQGTSFYPHGESSEKVDLPAYAAVNRAIGSDWPAWRYALIGAGLGAAHVVSQFIPLVGVFAPTGVGAYLGNHAGRGDSRQVGSWIGGLAGAGATAGVIWAWNKWPVETAFLPVLGASVALGAVLGLAFGRQAHNHMLRKVHARDQWWDRSSSTSQVATSPINSAAAGLNLGLDYASTYRRLEGAGLPEGAHKSLHTLLRHTSTGGWTAEEPWRHAQTGVGLAWCRPIDLASKSEAIVTPFITLDKPSELTLSARFKPPEDEADSEQAPLVKVESSPDGQTWKEVGSFRAGDKWYGQTVALPEPGRQKLRFTCRGGAQSGELQLASLRVGDTWRDGSEGGPGALIDLAVADKLSVEQRTSALERLAGMPEGVGWAVLHSLGEKKLAVEDLPALIERLPATLCADDVEAAVARVLDSPVGRAILEKQDSMVIGGVRVKRNVKGSAA